ncbi:MAG: hypothetical protein IPG01_10575 [Chitinophagaceae bacterium]|nr:hypothetical protein [Chitinophagaceae bacterium]
MPDIIHPSTSESIQNFINEQMGLTFQNSPIDPIANNIQARANQESLFQSLTTYNLEKGPSDVTAYHDFRVLKIAFEDVWQEVFDAKILVGGQRLYERYIELRETYEGLPAPEEITEASPSGEAEEAPSTDEAELITFINEINSAIGTLGSNSEVPPSILAIAPTITNKIFAMLTPSDMAQLQAWSDVYESFLSTNPPLETIVNSINTLWKPWTISLLAKYSSTSTDSIEGILLELNTALRQTYKFRVFAPGSYNFGVLITYRQKWEPGNYQVGNLINTIPLAPKETVKYSKKLVTKKKPAKRS